MFKIFVLLLLMVCSTEQTLVTVESGEVVIYGYDNCTIDANGVNMEFTNISKSSQSGYVLPGLWFGLIRFECDDTAGIIVSKIECKTCATYCVQNQYIPGCEYKNTAIILGIVSGVSLLLLSIGILFLINRKVGVISYVNFIITSGIVVKMYLKRDTDRMLHFKKMSKTNNVKYTLRFCMIGHEINPKIHHKIAANRDKLEKIYDDYIADREIPLMQVLGPVPTSFTNFTRKLAPKPTIIRPKLDIDKRRKEYNDLYSNLKDVHSLATEQQPLSEQITMHTILGRNDSEQVEVHVEPGRKSPTGSTGSGGKLPLFLSTAIMVCLFTPALTCDNTLFLNTQGKICDSNNCHDISTYLITILDGQVICFRTVDNELVTFEIKETITRTRYRSVYRTSDFDLETASYYECKGVGECWENGCHSYTKGKKFSDNPENNTLTQYGCRSDSIGCDTWCFHKTSCTYYKSSINKAGPLATIFKKVSSIWETSIKVCNNGTCTIKVFNTNNPSTNMVGEAIGSLKDFPITIMNAQLENHHSEDFLIEDSGITTPVRACELNYPQSGMIGDLQVELYSDKYDYPIDSLKCDVSSCKPTCNTREPGLRRHRRIRRTKLRDGLDKVKYIDPNLKELRVRSSSSISIVIGNVNFKNLHVEPAHCEISQVMNYACTGCNTDPYIVFQAYNIKSSGIMPMESNCSFRTNYISCTDDPYPMNVEITSGRCFIYMPTTNKTIFIDMETEFIGGIDLTKTIRSTETFSEMFKSLATSAPFWTSLNWTLGGCFVITGLISFLNRVIKSVALYKGSSSNVKSVQTESG